MRALGALLLGVVVVLLLRSTALSVFAARGLVVDVLAFAAVVWALRHGAAWGSTFGFVLGLAADLDAAHSLGRHALGLTLVGYVTGRLASTLVRESARTQFVLIWVAAGAHQAWSAPFEAGGWTVWPYLLFVRIVLSSLITAALGTLTLSAIRRVLGRPLFANVSVQPGQAF
jgi:rod shape-determining protein MreD